MSITNWLAGDAAAGRNAIEAEFTAAHSSFQNGGAERLNGVIQQKVKVLLNSSGVDSSYWNFAFNHAVFLHNYLPRAGGSSPFESIRGVAKPVKAEDPFGCRVFAKNFFEHNKLVNRSLSGTFIGYHKSTKVVFILEDKTNRILRTSAYKTVASVFPKKTGPAAVA
ncbi:hypothetical protein, partial [Pseudomonas laurentiana]|uniref:hypothetical protein n=1 Tax=Pseudomonas laurentiana TaxID=2364649 RepID=UPI001672B333